MALAAVAQKSPHADHLLTAKRLFSVMDMPLWLCQAASSLSELGVTEA